MDVLIADARTVKVPAGVGPDGAALPPKSEWKVNTEDSFHGLATYHLCIFTVETNACCVRCS